jgi:hypothetical protein
MCWRGRRIRSSKSIPPLHNDDEIRRFYEDDIVNLDAEDREAITFESWLWEYLLDASHLMVSKETTYERLENPYQSRRHGFR